MYGANLALASPGIPLRVAGAGVDDDGATNDDRRTVDGRPTLLHGARINASNCVSSAC